MGGEVAYQGRELEVVSDEHELICETQWAQTCRESDLRCFVDDAVVEMSPVE